MKMRYGTNSSTLIHSLYLRFVGNYIFNSTGSFTSIFDAMPKFNLFVCSNSRGKYLRTVFCHGRTAQVVYFGIIVRHCERRESVPPVMLSQVFDPWIVGHPPFCNRYVQ